MNAPPANNNGGAAADQQDDGGQQQQQLPLLRSLEDYIRTHGIAPVDDDDGQRADAFYVDPNHAQRRQLDSALYQKLVHGEAFAEHDAKERDAKVSKRQFLDTLKGQTISVLSTKEEVEGDDEKRGTPCATSVPLHILASLCDTVYTMVRSDRMLWSRQNSDMEDGNIAEKNDEAKSNTNWHQSTLDLTNFRSGPVRSFLSVITDASKSENDDISLANVPPEHIVDVCLISHYLQCISVMETSIDVLKESVDSDNCLSICQLADQLGSPSLFEAAVTHLIEKLDDMQKHDEWEEFDVTLRNRVV
eukprot:CAMPEP_0185810178 /NCGR_PEP_ID=MMETSP1322-20130828/6638_1 /TAXON_ID=265543 /ORGANISM="Minutocellus polymorphus, Strain RCC2270" /LENGTH=303 /DNA_ID=CAMNT_0028506483 /DNA_START=62 /DNA_END=969 /DNA_ORIENTATION=+